MAIQFSKLLSLMAVSSILSFSYSNYSFAENLEQEEELEQQDEKKEVKTTKMGGRNITAYSRKGNTSGVSVGGYFDSEYYFPDGKSSYFDQHRLITQLSSLYNDRLFFNAEIEYEHGGTINKGTNDGELKIEQAFLDYKIEDWLIFRGGGVLIPVGRLNVLHDSDYRDTTARPLFNTTIIPSTWTETGLGFYGTSYPNDDIELNYEIYVTHGLNDKIEDGKGLKPAAPSLYKDNNNNKAISTRLGISPFIGLDMGLGGYYSALDDKDSKSLGMAVADFDWKIGGFELLGEGGFVGFNPIDTKDKDGKVTGSLNGPMWGYYLEAKYHFFPEFLKASFLGRDFNNPRFTVFSRIDQVDTDMSKLNANDRTQLCFGFNYRPITNAVFKFEYQVNLENEAFVSKDFSKEKPNNQFIASIAAGF
jgi:hypothetical protein